MANEKVWKSACNINLQTQPVGADNEDKECKNFAFQLFHFLSGGAGNTEGAWSILTASNGSSVGDSGVITGPDSFTFANEGSGHSWFVARKNIFPPTGSYTNRYMWLTVDFEEAADQQEMSILFSHQEPLADGSTTARPTMRGENGSAQQTCTYVHDQDSTPNTLKFKYPYNASHPNYFHGCMDSTGSFVIFTTSGQYVASNYPKNPFTLACIRLETPTSASVDPYPVLMYHQYGANVTSYKGVWDKDLMSTYQTWNQTSQAEGGLAMFWIDGTVDSVTVSSQDGFSTEVIQPHFGSTTALDRFPLTGQQSDNTYPRLPLFVGQDESGKYCIRGRLPDITTAVGSANAFGYVVPGQGDVEACVIGDTLFPLTASILP